MGFLWDLRHFGYKVALYNKAWKIVHKNDAHVRMWPEGGQCMGCDNCPYSRKVRMDTESWKIAYLNRHGETLKKQPLGDALGLKE